MNAFKDRRCLSIVRFAAFLLSVPIIWSSVLVFLLYRCLIHSLAGRGTEPILGMSAFFAQGLKNGNGMVNIVNFLEGHPDLGEWREEVTERILLATIGGDPTRKRFPELFRSFSFFMGYPVVREVQPPDVERLVNVSSRSPVESEAELELIVNEHFNRTMPNNAPMWEIVIIHMKDGWRLPYHETEVVPGSCVLLRIHHCYADGVAIMRFISDTLVNDKERAQEGLNTIFRLTQFNSKKSHPTDRSVLAKVTLLLGWMLIIPFVLVKNLFEFETNRLTPPGGVSSGCKHFCWSRPVPLAKVKNIKNVLGGGTTVNDVIMSCAAGALRRWMHELPPTPAGASRVPPYVKACMAVNLQRLDEPSSLSNKLLLMSVRMLTGVEDPLERIVATKKMMDAMKESPLEWMSERAAQLTGILVFVSSIVVKLMSVWGPSLVYSNLPALPQPIDYFGHRLLAVSSCVPHSCTLGLSITLVSYCDNIVFNVVMDRDISEDMEEARRLITNIEVEIDVLGERVQHLFPTSC